jgi:putative transposase
VGVSMRDSIGLTLPEREGWSKTEVRTYGSEPPNSPLGAPPFMVGWLLFVTDNTPTRAYDLPMPRLRHYDSLGTARFVTVSCFQRHPLFRDGAIVTELLRHVSRLRTECGIRILGYVVMPEHVHLVLHPPDGLELGVVIGQLKGRSARALMPLIGGELYRSDARPAILHRRCYDHNCRTVETVQEKIRYCHFNPVHRGLVSTTADWPWSSFRWYEGYRDVPLAIDDYDL